ncbi:MAG: FAD:protein FMN transferase [Actinobacteria bacterium]|nr:MAG: FAD:protein FMN transferase [Actinomycetota bacterium]
MTTLVETVRRFACFGSQCTVAVGGPGAERAAADAEAALLTWHRRFTRFSPGSELSRLNADPRGTVPVTPTMARFVQAAIDAARATDGLVDATLIAALEDAGYRRDLPGSLPLSIALGLAPERRPAAPARRARWAEVRVDALANTVSRPPGVRLDSGGIAKGLFADLAGAALESSASYAVDCSGDLRLGGRDRLERAVRVDDPFGRGVHSYELERCGIATSGIGRRSWLDAHARPAHHLLDPSTLRPAFTGVVQATALAPTAFEAELRAKCAVLSGPEAAPACLPDGGLLVLDDGTHHLIP